jgi:sulfhydrogenase subunit beta (sulfur reductase)
MKSYRFAEGFEERLFEAIPLEFHRIGPVQGQDGVCRLQPVRRWSELHAEALPLIPLKKFLLPPQEELWRLGASGYRSPSASPPVALLGIPPCDLYALSYLDQVFSDDPNYSARRRNLLVIGAACTPNEFCFCPPQDEPPPFDLFLAWDRVWAGSAGGESLLLGLLPELTDEADDGFPAESYQAQGGPPPADLEALFTASVENPLWRRVGGRCLSCGACAAVCPTCYCYDVVDEALPDGPVVRRREWDNCFFRAHALVAGGHNFRPSREARLRFRFEHKMLGFGELRGIASCVGCGRCGRACPVEIDIPEVLAALTEGRGT